VRRFDDPLTARKVGIIARQPWHAEPPEVALPDAVGDLMLSQSLDVAVADEICFLGGWWVPDDDGFPVFFTPTDPLIDGDCGIVRAAA
jgi:hypothetical protein